MKIAIMEVARGTSTRPGYNEFHYNLALGYLAAAAEYAGHTALIIQQYDEPDEKLIKQVCAFSPDIVGFTCNTHNYPGTLAFKNKLKEHLHVPFVIGGVHATCAIEESTADFDVIVCGEGEETLIELLDKATQGWASGVWREIIGIAYRDDQGCVVKMPRRKRLSDLDRFGPPKRIDFFRPQEKQVYPAVPGHPIFAPISFSRGCRMQCSFCTNARMYQSQMVVRSPERIVAEMLAVRDKYGATDFYIHDEDLLSDVNLLRDVCRRLISTHANLTWMGMSSIHRITPDLVALMYEAGCIMLAFGLESGDDLLRTEFGKPFRRKAAQEKVQVVFDAGIIPVGLFVLGTPRETDETLEATFAFARSLKCIRYRFAYLYPYPGTKLREEIDRQGLWLNEKYKAHEYAAADIPVVRCAVETRKLVRAQRDFLIRLYDSPAYVTRLREFVAKNPSWSHSILKEWREIIERDLNHRMNWDS